MLLVLGLPLDGPEDHLDESASHRLFSVVSIELSKLDELLGYASR